MRYILLVVVSFALLLQPLGAQERQGERNVVQQIFNYKAPEGLEHIRDVEYGKGGDVSLKLDVLRLKTMPKEPAPVLVFIHGGAWMAGNKGHGLSSLESFARQGYFCATIAYRFTQVATYPAQIQDSKCAIRYLRAHASQYNIDAGHIGVWGQSAGAHLVALLGTTGDVKKLEGAGGWQDQSSRVQAVCDWFGPADIVVYFDSPDLKQLDTASGAIGKLLGGTIEDNPEKARLASPARFATPDDAPFLILHGNKDTLVPIKQSQILKEALEKAKVPVEMITVDGAGHGGGQFYTPENIGSMLKFFDKHLKQNDKK